MKNAIIPVTNKPVIDEIKGVEFVENSNLGVNPFAAMDWDIDSIMRVLDEPRH